MGMWKVLFMRRLFGFEFMLLRDDTQDTNLIDGAGSKPSYSLRTLCRALEYARVALPVYGLQRALYDGFAMAFLTQLHDGSSPRVESLLRHHFLGGVKSIKVQFRVTWPS